MKKTVQLLLLLVIAGVMMSCNKDPEEVTVKTTIEMPIDLNNVVLTNVKCSFTNIERAEASRTVEKTFTTSQSSYDVESVLEEGSYNVEVTGTITYDVAGTTATGNIKAVRNNVSISVAQNTISVATNIFNGKAGFVIEEIFFTGTTTPEGKQYSNDQYFKITNNSDEVLYADGLAIVESEFLTVSKYDYTPDIMNEAMSIDAIYCIPGSGSEHPVQPGESVTIALNAINHLDANPNSINLSNVDFEFYDESSNPNFQDVDNPSVTNLDKWYCYTASYFSLHNRGFKSYALVKPEVSKEDFLANYYYEANYLLMGEYEMTAECYKVPNSWVIDAVNLSVESEFQWIVTSPVLDAGWTHCGTIDHDDTRYNKAVIRKTQGSKLADTNNSTDDFNSEVRPSLL